MLTYEQASDKVIIALDCSRERAFELADMPVSYTHLTLPTN